MSERTITISGASKTFSVTGWRIGTIVAPPDATDAIRKVHDFLTVGAPAPLQEAVAVGLETLGDDYYDRLAHEYRARRDLLCRALVHAGFRCTPPQGANYVLADCSGVSDLPDDEFSFWLTKEIGVAPVPGSSFFSPAPAPRRSPWRSAWRRCRARAFSAARSWAGGWCGSRFVRRKRCSPKRRGGSPASGVPRVRCGRNLAPFRGGEGQTRQHEQPPTPRAAPESQPPLGLGTGAMLGARPRDDGGEQGRACDDGKRRGNPHHTR